MASYNPYIYMGSKIPYSKYPGFCLLLTWDLDNMESHDKKIKPSGGIYITSIPIGSIGTNGILTYMNGWSLWFSCR